MIPHPKSGQTILDVFANRTEWMLLDRSRISFDGTECDKVRAHRWRSHTACLHACADGVCRTC